VAFAQKKQDVLPFKAKKVQVKKRYLHYLVIEHNKKLLMKERFEGDVWQGLYDFVLVEKGVTSQIITKQTEKLVNEVIDEVIDENGEIIDTEKVEKNSLAYAIDLQIKELPILTLGGQQSILLESFAEPLMFVTESQTYLHKLTHQTMYVTFSHLRTNETDFADEIASEVQGKFYELAEIHELPKPILIDNYLKEYFKL
jgi:A/G-specific adenine glycosylase